MIDPFEATGWISAGKSALDLMRAALALMPRGVDRARIERTLAKAERSLELSDAKLAGELGYPLCRCVFPPKPMLWDSARGAFVCQNEGCGLAEDRLRP